MTHPAPVQDPDIQSFTATDRRDAEKYSRKIDSLIDQIKSGEAGLAKSYALLGSSLLHVRSKKYWLLDGHKSFGSYIDSIKAKLDKGRTQLYAAISAAERLLPYVNEDKLAEIGISNATTLASYVKNTGKHPSEGMIEKALTEGVQEFRMTCYSAQHAAPPEPGQWMDMGGCFFTAGEKEEWLRACKVAMIIDPPIKVELPDHMKKKEIFLRMARELLSTYENPVMGRQ